MIRTLERYVLAELLRTFAIALVALTFIFFLGTTFRLMKDELTYWQILKSLPYAIPYTLPHSLPMAFLVAVSLTFGRHVADREVLALESCGVAPRALAPPAILLGVVLCLLSIVVQSSYLPYCHQKMKKIQRAVLEEILSLGEGEHWCRNFRNVGFDIYVRKHHGPSLDGVVIHRDVGEQPATITAEHGEVTFTDEDGDDERVVFTLTNAITTIYSRDKVTQAPRDPMRVRFRSYVQEMAVGQGGRVKTSDYSTAELRSLARDETDARHFAGAAGFVGGATLAMDDRLAGIPVEIATRAAVATAPLVFLALGFPLVLALRSTNRLIPLVVGIAASAVFYFAPFLVGRTLAERPDGWPGWCFLGDVCALGAAALVWPIARGGVARSLVAKPLARLAAFSQQLVARFVTRASETSGTTQGALAPRMAGGLVRATLVRGLVVGAALALVPLFAGRHGFDPNSFSRHSTLKLPWGWAVLYFFLLGLSAAPGAAIERLTARLRLVRAPAILVSGLLAIAGVVALLLFAGVELAYARSVEETHSIATAFESLEKLLPWSVGGGSAPELAGYRIVLFQVPIATILRARGLGLRAQVALGVAGAMCGVGVAILFDDQVGPFFVGPAVLGTVFAAVLPLLIGFAESLASRERAPAEGEAVSSSATPAAARRARPGSFSVWDHLPIKTLDRMLLRRFAFTYAAFASSVVLIFVVTDIFNKFARFSGENRNFWQVIGEYYLGVLPEIYYMLAPFVTLIAAMWVLFELRRNNELTPLMAAGIPAWRVTAPVIGAAVFLSVAMFADREWVICNPTLSELRRESGKFGKRDHRVPVPVPDCHDGVLAASTYLTKTRELFHARFVQLDPEGREVMVAFGSIARYVAPDCAFPEGWHLPDGFIVRTQRSPDGSATETLELIPPGGTLLPLDIRPLDVECAIDTIDYLSTEQMENQLKRIPSLRHLAVQLARRYSYPASALVLLVIGLPFILRGDKSAAALGILICIAVCALFFIVSAFSEDLGAKPWGPPPALAAWLPDVLFGVPGLIAFFRTAR